ncbi:endonuclease [Thalassospira sp. MCCC 1A01148]|uniref:Endonuclease n=1 Tax=Thalassospira profundimaris TaxID=502049 RepID=A0A367V6X2_9PROT|nr:endonuclease [Thalassospira sp. MCCC 1A01148]RCK20883.1 endonuclease [Thalassospira profundimaris]
MAMGRSIRLFLVDGTPTGIITAEIMNWTGHIISAPRINLPHLLKRHEVTRTGVYFLSGPNPENPNKTLVYIGESDNVSRRLISHNNDASKEFWDKTFVITSKDQNLTKAHARYLESRLISIAASTGRINLVNATAPEYGYLPEADLADMEFFIEQIRIVMPVLGMDFLREKPNTAESPLIKEASTERSPTFEIYSPKYKLTAKARQIDGDFVVLAGSHARSSWDSSAGGYRSLHEQLIEEGRLVPEREGILYFNEDTIFSSPSAASATIFGRPDNGRTTWRVEGTNKTYADWQNEQISSSTEPPSNND